MHKIAVSVAAALMLCGLAVLMSSAHTSTANSASEVPPITNAI